MKRWFGLALLMVLVVVACGDDGPSTPSAPCVTAVVSFTALGGGPPQAGFTMLSTVQVTNTGGPAAELTVTHPRLDAYFERLPADIPDFPLSFGPFELAGGATRDVVFEFLVPESFPGGWEVQAQAAVTSPELGEEVLATDPVFGGVPRSFILNSRPTLTLEAPGVTVAYAVGEFNGWTPRDADLAMWRHPVTEEFGIAVLATGRFEYKFVIPTVGGDRWITDPRATQVVSDGFGGLNSVGGVPLPEPLPGLAGGIVPEHLIIYELFVDDFSPRRDFQGVLDGLDGGPQAIAELGVTAIELLPVTATLPGFNWGYEPQGYFAVNHEYGTPEEFAQLVQAIHDRGMAVILDMVFNHVGGGSPLQTLDELGTPGTWLSLDQPNVFGMRQTNWFSEPMQDFFLEAALFWIEQYGIDGFRMDFTDGNDYPGYTEWASEIKSRHPDVFIIGEDFNPPPFNCVTVAGFDAQWGGQKSDGWGGISNNFQNTVMALLIERPYFGRAWNGVGSFDAATNPMWGLANILSANPGFPTHLNEVKYIVSHDERRVVDEVSRSSDAAQAIGGVQKAKLGALTLLTTVGIPMFYMGEEIGEDDFTPDIPAPNPVDWDQGNPDIRLVYQNLITLRGNVPSLTGGKIEFFCPSWDQGLGPCQQSKTVNFWRYLGDDPQDADVVVVINYDHESRFLPVQFPAPGPWIAIDPETALTVEFVVPDPPVEQLELLPSQGWIFLKNPMP